MKLSNDLLLESRKKRRKYETSACKVNVKTKLEFDTANELDDAWIERGVDTSETCRVNVSGSREHSDEEVGTVENIECLSTYLEADLFRNTEILHQRCIPVEIDRTIPGVAYHIARLARSYVEEDLSREWKSARVKSIRSSSGGSYKQL